MQYFLSFTEAPPSSCFFFSTDVPHKKFRIRVENTSVFSADCVEGIIFLSHHTAIRCVFTISIIAKMNTISHHVRQGIIYLA